MFGSIDKHLYCDICRYICCGGGYFSVVLCVRFWGFFVRISFSGRLGENALKPEILPCNIP